MKVFGCSTRQVVHQRAGEHYNNACLLATLKDGGQCLQVWDCLLRSKKVRNTSRYISIMQYHKGGIYLAPNLFCSRKTTSKNTTMSLRTVMVRFPQSPDLNIIHISDYKETEGFEPDCIHRKSVDSSPRCLEQSAC